MRSASRSALLIILVGLPLVEAEPAENITFVLEPADKKIKFLRQHQIFKGCFTGGFPIMRSLAIAPFS